MDSVIMGTDNLNSVVAPIHEHHISMNSVID